MKLIRRCRLRQLGRRPLCRGSRRGLPGIDGLVDGGGGGGREWGEGR